MNNGATGFREFFWTCFSKALHSSYGIAGAISLALTVVGGATQDQLPWTRPGWEYLSWVIPLAVGIVLFVPALLLGGYDIYRATAAERDSMNSRLASIESHFDAKERLGMHLYHMNIIVRRFETWNAESGRESPVEQTRKLLNDVEQSLIDNVGLHYAARLNKFSARQRNETDLQNSYNNLRAATAELERIISELPD